MMLREERGYGKTEVWCEIEGQLQDYCMMSMMKLSDYIETVVGQSR